MTTESFQFLYLLSQTSYAWEPVKNTTHMYQEVDTSDKIQHLENYL